MPGGILPPLSVVASWPKANEIDPVRRGPANTIICVLFMVLATIAVVLRLWTRFRQRQLFFEDGLIVLGLMCTLAMSTFIIINFEDNGFDRHVWDLVHNIPLLVRGRKGWWYVEMFYVLAAGFTKISILLFARRLTLRIIRKPLKILLWISIVFIALTSVVFLALFFVECRPLHAFWSQVDPFWRLTHQHHCFNEGAKLMAAGSLSTAQDFIAAILPIIILYDLSTTPMEKLGRYAIFAVGLITCFVGVARTVISHIVFFETYDVTWWAAPLGVLCTVELCTGITVACTPMLYGLRGGAKHVFEGIASKLRRSRNPQTNTTFPYDEFSSVGASSKKDAAGFYTQQLETKEDETTKSVV